MRYAECMWQRLRASNEIKNGPVIVFQLIACLFLQATCAVSPVYLPTDYITQTRYGPPCEVGTTGCLQYQWAAVFTAGLAPKYPFN